MGIEITRNTGRISFDRMSETNHAGCINLDMLQEYWLWLRCAGPDLFRLVKFSSRGPEMIQRGWLPHGDEDVMKKSELVESAKKLEAQLVGNLDVADRSIKKNSDFFEQTFGNDGYYLLYCRNTKGVTGIGWYSSDGNVIKAKMMAAFTLYIVGLSSAQDDPILWEVAYRHLPFAQGAGIDLKVADELFTKYLVMS